VTWWATLYDDALADMLLERADAASIERTIDFLRRVLAISPGDHVFDQCCGIGSLAVPLAIAGFRVTGVDQAARYIERATTAARRAEVTERGRFATGDAFAWRPDTPCDAAFNWWTSFGYAERDADNILMLRRAFDALVPGGRYALDFINLPQVLRDFQRHVALTRETPRGIVTLLRETELDLGLGYMRKTWQYFFPDGSRHNATSRLKLYLPHQLVDMLLAAGFEDVALYGDETGEALTIDSPRCIAVGRKARG